MSFQDSYELAWVISKIALGNGHYGDRLRSRNETNKTWQPIRNALQQRWLIEGEHSEEVSVEWR